MDSQQSRRKQFPTPRQGKKLANLGEGGIPNFGGFDPNEEADDVTSGKITNHLFLAATRNGNSTSSSEDPSNDDLDLDTGGQYMR